MEDDIELLRLRAKAKFKREQEAKKVQASSEQEPGTLENIQRKLNLVGGAGRASVFGALEPLVGKDLVSREQVAAGTVPSTSEILAKMGVPEGYSLSDIIPAMYSPSGEEWLKFQKGGALDPTARGALGLAGDIAFDLSTYLLPGLKGAGILGSKLAPIAAKIGPRGTRAAEIALNPLGEAFTGAIKGTGAVGKAIAGKASQFRPEEALQYLTNYPAVKEAVGLLSSSKNLDIAQQKAFEAINKMRTTLAKYGKEADLEMNSILEGKNVQANLNSLKEMAEGMPPKKKAEYLNIIKNAEKDLEAYRPFEPEFTTSAARQQGVEGLTFPATEARMTTPSISEVIPEQQSLFDIKELNKQQPEFLIPPKDVIKTEGTVIPGRPAVSEYFPPEGSSYSTMMQEPLPILPRSTRPESATIPAQQARRLKQMLQAEAKYGKSSPVTAVGTPRYTEYAEEANKLAQSLREIDKVKQLDDYMRFGIVSQEALQKAESAPLQFLKTQSEDVTAALSRAARRTGDEEVFNLANQLGAARKIIGKGDYDDWLSRSGIRLAGRGALRAIDKFQKTGTASQDMINKVLKDPNVPSQVWMEMLRSKQPQEGNE